MFPEGFSSAQIAEEVDPEGIARRIVVRIGPTRVQEHSYDGEEDELHTTDHRQDERPPPPVQTADPQANTTLSDPTSPR